MKLHRYWSLGLLGATMAAAAEPLPKDSAAPPQISADALYQTGKELFESLPSEVKDQFDFPDRAQWDAFLSRLQLALDGSDPEALAQLEPEARTALAALRAVPGSEEYLGWLEERLDDIAAAREMAQSPAPQSPVGPPGQFIPNYDLWLRRLAKRAAPAAAEKYVRQLRPVFAAGGVPAELVWLAEAESGFNPTARSPAGARGLFQLMPATARELGLRTAPMDERTDPEKSAQAAARLLRELREKFGDWPLALAAYNAGPGRVQRALDQTQARTFAAIAAALPLETRLYVPKVLALLTVRAGVSLTGSAAPLSAVAENQRRWSNPLTWDFRPNVPLAIPDVVGDIDQRPRGNEHSEGETTVSERYSLWAIDLRNPCRSRRRKNRPGPTA